MKLQELAQRLGGKLENAEDNPTLTGVTGIEEASQGQVTFVSNPKYAGLARSTGASLIIVGNDFPDLPRPLLRHENPYLAFARAIALFYPQREHVPGIQKTAIIHQAVRGGKDASSDAYVDVEHDVQSENHGTLLPHVVNYP